MDDIRRMLGEDIVRLNNIIADTLRSDSMMTNAIVTQYLRTKGKQLRPILVLLSARFFGDITDAVLYGAAAIEMLHNASLIHDDVIDQAGNRRGNPTINSVWDNHVAVLIGDLFVSGALQAAVHTGSPRVLQSLASMGRDLSTGEINQIDTARRHLIDEETYMDNIRRKTASLFVSCVTVGGITAGANDDTLRVLTSYAELLGLCFQIKDDIFDYYDLAGVGKPTGNDLREGKLTLPLIHALGHDTDEACAMRQLITDGNLDEAAIAGLVDYAKRAGGIDYAQSVMHDLRYRAATLLDPYAGNPVTPLLLGLLDYIINRDH